MIMDRKTNPENSKEEVDNTSEVTATNKFIKKRSSFGIAVVTCILGAIASIVLCFLYTFLFWADFTFFLVAAIFFIIMALVLSIINYAISFSQTNHRRPIYILEICIIISLLIAGVSFFFSNRLQHQFFRFGFFLSFTIAVILGITVNLILLRRKHFLGGVFTILLILFLCILLLFFGLPTLRFILAHIYTPPSITSRNFVVLKNCIKFAKMHDEYKDIGLTRWNIVSIGDDFYSPDSLLFEDKTKGYFTKNDISEIKNLLKRLDSVRCRQFQRNNDMVLFYKNANSILPTAPGVLYSLSGKNPNVIDSEVLNAAKPFVKIAGNWYMSRHLTLRGHRMDVPVSIPKSLIDHSLRTDGLDLTDENNISEFGG